MFGALPPSSSETLVRFSAPGFARLSFPIELKTAVAAQANAALELGTINEVVTVAGTGRPKPAAPVAMGGQVTAARLVLQQRPVYPPNLKQAGVQGAVMLTGIVQGWCPK